MTGLDEFLFSGGGVHQQHVGVTVLGDLQGLAGAHGHPFQLDAGLFLEGGGQELQQAGILGAGGGGHHQRVGSLGRSGQEGGGQHGQEQFFQVFHDTTP